jgi:hypothetical protein
MSSARNSKGASEITGQFSAYMPKAQERASIQPPTGSRSSHFYMSPKHKVNETFNFWHDVKANLVTRSNWEDKSNAHPIVPAAGDASNRRGLDSSATRLLMRDQVEPNAQKEREHKVKKKAAMEEK